MFSFEHNEERRRETAVSPSYQSSEQTSTITPPAPQKNFQRKQNRLPDRLKAGVEALSGLSMDDVQVHYNSPKPANLQALAYTQGNQIHVGPGQEKHLPHEAWHVVQQKLGRVKSTTNIGSIPINDAPNLEAEAERMGHKAKQFKLSGRLKASPFPSQQKEETQRKTEAEVSSAKPEKNGRFRIDIGQDNRKFGSVMLHNKNESTIELTDLAVNATNRKHGLGKKLIQSAVQTGKQMGKSKVSLAAQDKGSGKLKSWYKKMGFSQVGINHLGYPKMEAPIHQFESQPVQRIIQLAGGAGAAPAPHDLFGNYKAFRASGNNMSNSPNGCPQITHSQANNLKRQWQPKSSPNSWNYSSGHKDRHNDKYGATRWVSGSLTGKKGKRKVVDFHALINGKRFL